MAVNWPDGVNNKVYGLSTTMNDNLQVQTFESGAKRTWLKNSVTKKKFSFLLLFSDRGSDSEFKKFLSWYDNVCLSGSISFYFLNLISKSGVKEYKFTEVPTIKGNIFKEVSFDLEEV